VDQAIGRWFERTGVASPYIVHGAPWESGMQSFHIRLRGELLDVHAIGDLREARAEHRQA